MSITTWRYRDGSERRIDHGRPWPPEGDPWRERAPEFTRGAIHWRWDEQQSPARWELVEAAPRTVLWISTLIVWIVDRRAQRERGGPRRPGIVTLDDGARRVIYRLVHKHDSGRHLDGDTALWLEWVD